MLQQQITGKEELFKIECTTFSPEVEEALGCEFPIPLNELEEVVESNKSITSKLDGYSAFFRRKVAFQIAKQHLCFLHGLSQVLSDHEDDLAYD